MNKRGQSNWVLEMLGKAGYYIPIFLLLLFILVMAVRIFLVEKPTAEHTDLERLKAELLTLAPGEKIEVPVRGSDYEIQLIPAGSEKPTRECSKQEACICFKKDVKKDDKVMTVAKCRPLEGIAEDCSKDKPCVERSQIRVEGPTLQICRNQNKLAVEC